jgi:hypothetical protein
MPERNSMVDCSAARATSASRTWRRASNGRMALSIQGSEGGSETLFGFGEDKINMNFDAAPKLLECTVGGLLQERARFADASLEFQEDFLGRHLLLFHQTDEMAIGDTSSESFKFFGGAAHGLLDGGEVRRMNFADSTFGKVSCF